MSDADAERHGSSPDTNQIAAAAAACQLLFTKHRAAPESQRSPELPPELDLLSELTQQIKILELGGSSEDRTKSTDAKAGGARSECELAELASLHCQRAQRILESVDYDASARLPLALLDIAPTDSNTSSSSDGPEERDEGHISDDGEHTFRGVEQALEDALAATAAAPTSANGHFLAAQCHRCLGSTSRAIEHITRALELAPHDAADDIQQLANELAVDASDLPMRSDAPPLTTPAELLAVFETANQGDEPEEQQQQQQDEEASEPARHDTLDSTDDRESFHQVLRAGHQRLAAIAASASLAKLEQMMHQNVHHQCAAHHETHDVETAFNDAAGFLWQLLGNRATVTALGLVDRNGRCGVATDMLAIATSGAGSRLLVESRPLRKWVAQTLAPAARRFPTQLGRAPLATLAGHAGSAPRDQLPQVQEAVLAMLVHDALLVLTRVLLALAGWRRCTSMPHALMYAELCSDLAKEVGARDGAFSGLSRFEMLCSDAYGRALLELTAEHNDALQVHQESFQAALATRDALYELRAHHLVGQAYLRLRELELAHAEFSEMLELSRAVGDAQMACLAHYELGDCWVQRGNVPQAHAHLKLAQTLCHQTAHARGSWRLHSVRQAIAFYEAMRPARRGAIRAAAAAQSNKPHRRHRGSLVPPPQPQEPPGNGSEAETSNATKLRRPAIWIGPPRLRAEHDSGEARSLLRALLGEQTEPQVAANCCGDDARGCEKRARTATEKLFARTPTGCGGGKPRRAGAWRDSVFAVPPSYAELKSLAAAAVVVSPASSAE
ncbi:hypothetical protein PybrP1_010031 [[Pythium] brassicae (nom. inval.)]|nr:hypothetical protein PybrP1_010031 [[Pythium] brassicae (nom. inval.)]